MGMRMMSTMAAFGIATVIAIVVFGVILAVARCYCSYVFTA